jgi:uncharacterized protein YbgA (DUF1722 family)/uncharacterized protein YbbK (DUF523 family)
VHADEEPLRIGVSSCLLGQEVRFDGGHKRSAFLTDQLAPYVEWVPVCPEVEVGMGVPRPTVRLERHEGDVRMIEPRSGADHTDAMSRWAAARASRLRQAGLHGYVLKKDSPSCGFDRVKVYPGGEKGMAKRDGRGLFAEALIRALPELPVEDEGRLNDPRLRENFIERLFAHRRLRQLFRPRWRSRDVVAFHTAHKLQIMAHSPQAYRELGRLVAAVKGHDRADFQARYETGFMQALAKMATPGRTTNVLQHMAGYVRKQLEPHLRAELTTVIEDYRTGLVPLVVPVTLLQHHARRFEVEYLLDQVFLSPHPKELMLRNHV